MARSSTRRLRARFSAADITGQAQPGGLVGLWCPAQQLKGVGCIQVVKCQQGRGKVLPQGGAQPGHVTAAVPDQRLVRARGQLDRLTEVGVLRDRSMMSSVQADDLGQEVRIGSIGLGSRGGVPLAVAGHRQRVDREDLVARRDQGGDPGPSVGLDADLHQCSGFVAIAIDPVFRHLRSDQRVQPGDSFEPLGQSSSNQNLPVVIDDLDVVMALCPVISHKQHQHSRPGLHGADTLGSVEETASDLMVKCSPQTSRGTSSQQRFRLLTTSRRTVCRKTCMGQMRGVLTCQPLPEPSLSNRLSRSH